MTFIGGERIFIGGAIPLVTCTIAGEAIFLGGETVSERGDVSASFDRVLFGDDVTELILGGVTELLFGGVTDVTELLGGECELGGETACVCVFVAEPLGGGALTGESGSCGGSCGGSGGGRRRGEARRHARDSVHWSESSESESPEDESDSSTATRRARMEATSRKAGTPRSVS